jgi:tetratricopeptide (TPR) repeat protein
MSKIDGLLTTAAARMETLEFGSAIEAYRRVLQQVPNQAPALMGLSIAYNRVGRSADALPLLGRLWAVASKRSSAPAKVFKAAVLAQVGYAQQQLGQFKLAHEAFESAHQLIPSDELKARLAALEPYVHNQDPLKQLLHHARNLEASSQPQEALQAYRAAAQLRPNDVSVLQGTAWLLRRMGHVDEALPLLQKALVLAPERPELHNDMGVLFQDREDYAKAITFHKRALRFKPDFTPALINIGVAQKRLGRIEEAIQAYQAALAIDANLPEAHNNLGNLYRIQGRHAEALQHIQRALQLRPDYSDAQANWDAAASQAGPAPAIAPTRAASLSRATPQAPRPVKSLGRKKNPPTPRTPKPCVQ